MRKTRTILAISLIITMFTGIFPGFTHFAAAADLQITNVFVERTDNEVLETVKGVIEIDGNGLKDAMVRIRTTAGGGTKILGSELGRRVANENVYLKFELSGAEMKSVLLGDGINIGGLVIAVDDANFATINSVEPKVVYLGKDQLVLKGSNLDRVSDVLTFGNGTLNGTIERSPAAITISNLAGDTGFHDLIFTRVNTGVTNLQPGGQVTIRRLYQNQFRVVQEMNIPGLEMYPNKGVPQKTTVFIRAKNLDKYSVFFIRNTSDPFYAANMGTNHEYIPNESGDDIIKVRVPNITPGTYRVVLTNFLTNPPAGTDLRNLITKQQIAGDFLVVSSSDAAEIVSINPAQGPNLSNNAVTIIGYNFEELIIDGLSLNTAEPPQVVRSLDKKSLELDYGSGVYNLGTGTRNVQVKRTLKVIIATDVEFQEESQQVFVNKQYDTLRVLTQTIPNSEIETQPSKDVIIELVTELKVEGSNDVYKFTEQAIREKGYLFIKSYTEPIINDVIPRNIQVIESAGIYVTKADLVISITGRSFMVTKYVDPASGQEYINYPIVDLGGSIALKREGKDKNQVKIKNLYPLDPAIDEWMEINGASLEVLDGTTVIDGSAGKEIGTRLVIRIPAGIEVRADRLNFPTYVEVTNPKKNASEHGYPIRKDDAMQFVVVGEAKTPVITSVEPQVVATEGEKGIRINGYNFQADVKVYIDGQEVKGIKRDPSSQLITFDAPPGREGETRLVVMNPEGGADSASFIYVKTQTNPKITGISPPEGTIGTLVVINGDVFLGPDPTATVEGIGIYRLLGTRVFFDSRDVNDYRYRSGSTTVIEPQGYVAPAGDKILRVEGGRLIMADYYASILLRDSSNRFYIFKKSPAGQPVLTDGVNEWTFSNQGSDIKAADQNGQTFTVSMGGDDQQDEVTLSRTGSSFSLAVLTPYAVNGENIIIGHRARVVDGGKRIMVTVPDLQVQGMYDVTVVNPDTKKYSVPNGFRFFRSPQRIPKVTKVVPDRGSTAGGYYIDIYGENFEETTLIKTRVFINSIEVSKNDTTVSPDGTMIRVKVPPYPGDLRKELGVDYKAVPIVVLNPSDGGSTGLPGGFTYIVPTSQPIIDNLTIKEGTAAGGDYVQIIGRDFRFYEPFEDRNGNFQYDDGEQFVDINGNGSWDDLRKYNSVEEIPAEQRDYMIKLLPQVYFGNQTAQVLDFGSNFIGVFTPQVPAGTVSVYVVNNDYGVSNSKPFTFKGSSPKISSVIPDIGRKQGGEAIEIHGSGFAESRVLIIQPDGAVIEKVMPLVRFGNLTGSGEMVGGRVVNLEVEGYLKVNYDANRDTITLTLQPSVNQVYQQTFSYDGKDRFFPLNQLQDVEGKFYSGQELIRIRVVQDPGNRLRVERGFAPTARLISFSQIEVTTPAYYTVGKIPLAVINPDGGIASGSFTYRNPDSHPRITNIIRDEQQPQLLEIEGKQVQVLRMNYKGNSLVSVLGEDFRENAIIKIGNLVTIQPAQITYTLPNKLTFTMPNVQEGEIGKLHRLLVINEDGASAASDQPQSGLDKDKIYLQFTKGETIPVIEAISPSLGPASGGTRVKIEGKDFRASLQGYPDSGVSVYFGGQKAPQLEVADYRTIWVTTPAASPGPAAVRVENPDGEIANLTGSFTYISAPRVTAIVDPAKADENIPIESISVLGGQEIKIKGTGFMPGLRVVFAPVLEKASQTVGSNLIYRVTTVQEGGYTSTILDPYLLKEGSNGSDVKYIDAQTITVKTPPGKLDSFGLIVINPDQGASPDFADISYQLPELPAPSGKVYAEIIYDQHNRTDRAIKVVWNSVAGASEYEIYVVRGSKTGFVGSTRLTSYMFNDLQANTTYRFIVKAVGDFGSSPPSAESNWVRTGSQVGPPDEDGKPGENTVIKREGTIAYVTMGSKDYSRLPLVVDLTRGDLAGSSQVIVAIPASVVADSSSAEINIRGTDFRLKFRPQVFKTSRVAENRGRSDAGIRFRLAPLAGSPPQSPGNMVSAPYQFEAAFYRGQEQSPIELLDGAMIFTLDYDPAKAQLRRFQEVAIYRYDQAAGTYVPAPVVSTGTPSAGVNRMGIYSVMGIRR